MYQKYQIARHAESVDECETQDTLDSISSLYYGSTITIEMDYRIDGRLFAVGIVDCGRISLSSNYFFYNTEYLPRRPGVFSMLTEIGLARSSGKTFLYPGFYIEGNSKMSYKKFFTPNQIYYGDRWQDFMVSKQAKKKALSEVIAEC